MLKITARALQVFNNNCRTGICNLPHTALSRSMSSFTSRDFTYNTYNSYAGDSSGTLATRFIKHIAIENCKNDLLLVKQTIKYSEFYPFTDFGSFSRQVKSIETSQIARLIVFTYTYKTNGDPYKVAQIINTIDDECMRRISAMSDNEISSILYSFMYLIPTRITQLDFFMPAIRKLAKSFDHDGQQRKESFVELCFYMGLKKSQKEVADMLQKFVATHFPTYDSDLNSVDFAVIANATFKASTPISNETFRNRLETEALNMDLKDDSIFVTILKCIRQNRIKSEELCKKLSQQIEDKQLKRLQVRGIAHIFAYLADNQYNEPEICKVLTENSLNKYETLYDGKTDLKFVDDGRSKDLSTLIWSCAYLQLDTLKETDFQFIEQLIEVKISNNEYRKYPDELVNTVLSLWMLGYKSKKLLDLVFNNCEIPSQHDEQRVRLDSRYKLLLSCVQLEQPEWMPERRTGSQKYFEENRIAPEYLIKSFSDLKHVLDLLDHNLESLQGKRITAVMPIDQINIAGLLLEMNDGAKVFIEILEDDKILKFGNKPSAIHALKIRLLEGLGYNVVVVHRQDKSDDEIIDEINSKIASHTTDQEETNKATIPSVV